MRHLLAVLLFTLIPVASQAATLEKLTLDEMIQKSTDIVQGKVAGWRVSERGPLVYTHWKIQISGRWKGESAATMEVVTPGGAVNGIRQVFPGAPTLAEGTEYVLFLWTGKTKLTHVIGLTQGLFDLKLDGAGVAMLSRPASTEVMIDPKTAREVDDEAVRMKLSDLSGRIRRVLETARQ
jgi:hypothetical protein